MKVECQFCLCGLMLYGRIRTVLTEIYHQHKLFHCRRVFHLIFLLYLWGITHGSAHGGVGQLVWFGGKKLSPVKRGMDYRLATVTYNTVGSSITKGVCLWCLKRRPYRNIDHFSTQLNILVLETIDSSVSHGKRELLWSRNVKFKVWKWPVQFGKLSNTSIFGWTYR